MKPAFLSTSHALSFGLLLLVLLTLPVILHGIGAVSLEQSYRGVSERAGKFDYIRLEIFDEHSPVDILFCGNSLLHEAIDTTIVQRDLSRALGRSANVVFLPQAWQGWDMHYYVSRDLIERRKVKMLVMVAPAFIHHSNQPHVQLFRVVRYGDHPGSLDGLAFRSQAAIYAAYVLGAPRQALTLFRANLRDPLSAEGPHKGTRKGYAGSPFVERTAAPASLDPHSLYALDRSNPLFHFEQQDLNDYQFHFLKMTADLARQYGLLLVILHMPSPSERGEDFVPWQRRTADLLGHNVAIAGIPSAGMFGSIPPDQYLDYFQDEHLNANGMTLFTAELAPALVELYARRP
jgi:hypothetical protein